MVNLLLSFLLRRNINSETLGKLKNAWHWLTISEDPAVLNILNEMLLRGNPSDLSCEELNGNASDAYSRQGMSIVFFSVQSAAGSTLSVQLWNMLDPPFSGLSVGRRSLRDWRPAVRTGMKWPRLAGASP